MTEDELWVRRNEIKNRFKRYGVSHHTQTGEFERILNKIHMEEDLVNRKRRENK